MKVEKNVVVSLSYTLKNEAANGDVIEICDASKPLEFVCLTGSMLPQFEQNILGLEQGSSFEFTLSPEDAYGIQNPQALVTVKKDIFIIDGVLREDLLVIGNVLPMRNEAGNAMNGIIKEIDDESGDVIIDFNHPLAGQTLYFTGKIESLRAATEDEVAHGLAKGGCGGNCGCSDSGGGCNDGDCGCDDSGGCGSGCGCN